MPAISAAALAFELAERERSTHTERMRVLCRSFWDQVQRVLPQARVNGPDPTQDARLCNTLNLSLPGIDGRVLVALGRTNDEARAGVRFSFGSGNDEQDVRASVDILRRIFSPSR